MTTLTQGQEAPDGELEFMDGTRASVASFRGQPLVLYFYPKDDTSGCTREAQDFSKLSEEFEASGTRVIGVSRDTLAAHRKFTEKFGLSVALASDGDGSLCEAFGTWVEKSMYGRKYLGIERSTFLIDADGAIARIWRKVKVPDHAAEVLNAVRQLAQPSEVKLLVRN